MDQIWKQIIGYENRYLVSNLGSIKSLVSNKILKVHYGSCGYLNVFLYDGKNHKKTKKIHRLVAEAFIDNLKNKLEVNHKDGNKHNNEINNLEWCTSRENALHAFSSGLKSNKGERNPFSKFNESDIIKIRELDKEGMSRTKIGKLFNTPYYYIWEICTRRCWKHI